VPSVIVKITQREVNLMSKKQNRALMKIIREDTIVMAYRGIGPDGGQYAPYKTKGMEDTPVDLTENGSMLETIKISFRKTTGRIKVGEYYGRFVHNGTITGKRLRKKADEGARVIGGRRVEGRDIGPGHVALPARPFMVLRPATRKKIQRWLEYTLDRSFKADSLRDTFNTGGVI